MSQLADGTRVYVHNLPWQITNAELAALMEQAGTVESAEVLRFSNGRSKGCAIVKYASVTEAMQAIAMLNNVEVQGRELLVREDREGPQGPVPGSRPRATGPTVVKAAARMGGGAGGNGGGNGAAVPRHVAPGVPAVRNLPAEVAVCGAWPPRPRSSPPVAAPEFHARPPPPLLSSLSALPRSVQSRLVCNVAGSQGLI